MDLRKLKTLIDLVSESNVSELEITEAEGKVRIVKGGPPVGAPIMVHPSMMTPPLQPLAAAHAVATPATDPASGTSATAAGPAPGTVTSPMVGTFYRSSSPGGKPLVDVGSTVKVGDPLCIIEAMKIMNEIEADRAGTVTKVFCDNGQAVEFGQPLFVVE